MIGDDEFDWWIAIGLVVIAMALTALLFGARAGADGGIPGAERPLSRRFASRAPYQPLAAVRPLTGRFWAVRGTVTPGRNTVTIVTL